MQTPARRNFGFTLIEMMVAMLISSIMLLAIANVLAQNHKFYNKTYRRVFSDVVTDAYVVRLTFDEAVRKASIKKCIIGAGNDSVELYYYSDPTASECDRYAYFYFSGTALLVTRGALETGSFDHAADDNPLTATVARNVTYCYFDLAATVITMKLILDNGQERLAVNCSAARHNE